MPHQPLASSRFIPLLQTALHGCPCCKSPLCAALSSQRLRFHQRREQEPSRARGAAGWEMPLGAARPVQPSTHLPQGCVQAACPAHSSAGCILITAHSMTEILKPCPKQCHWQGMSLPKGSFHVHIPSLP